MTCNYKNKIITALSSRCQGFHFEKLDKVEFTTRVANILIQENVQFDLDLLDNFVGAAYPDLRKCINNIQMSSVNGVLQLPTADNAVIDDYKITAVELFKQGKNIEARKLTNVLFDSGLNNKASDIISGFINSNACSLL